MAWLFVPESKGSNSAFALRAEPTAPSVLWRGSSITSRVWRREWRKGTLTRLLSGTISDPSTAARGVAEFISSLPAIRASHTAWQASASELPTPGTCGLMSSASSPSASPRSCSSRTWGGTLPMVFGMSPKAYRDLATRLQRRSSARLRSARRTYARASLLWPTIVASDGDRGPTRYSRGNPSLVLAARLWATCLVAGHRGHAWQQKDGKPTLTLVGQARLWATIKTRDFKLGVASHCGRYGTEHGGVDLTDQAAAFACGRLAATTGPDGTPFAGLGSWPLNPLFGEWKNGFPIGWSGLEPLEAASFRWWRLLHSCALARLLASGR